MSGGDRAAMPPWLRSLVELSAAVAAGAFDDVETCLAGLCSSDVPEGAVEEAILQLYLFVGFPATLNVAGSWRARSMAITDRDPLADATLTADWIARGEQVCREVYGNAYENLRANVTAIHPALDRWMVMEGYGKVLGRPGLELAQRELCIIAILAFGGWLDQLHSHLRGARRAGAPDAWITQALELGLERTVDGRRKESRDLWARVRSRREGDTDVH